MWILRFLGSECPVGVQSGHHLDHVVLVVEGAKSTEGTNPTKNKISVKTE